MKFSKGQIMEIRGMEVGHQVAEILETYERASLLPDDVDVQAWIDNTGIDYTMEIVGNPWYKVMLYGQFEDTYLPQSELEPTIVRILNDKPEGKVIVDIYQKVGYKEFDSIDEAREKLDIDNKEYLYNDLTSNTFYKIRENKNK